jgi:hypothetical protein
VHIAGVQEMLRLPMIKRGAILFSVAVVVLILIPHPLSSRHSQFTPNAPIEPSDNVELLWIQLQEMRAHYRALDCDSRPTSFCKQAKKEHQYWEERSNDFAVKLKAKYGTPFVVFDQSTGRAAIANTPSLQ